MTVLSDKFGYYSIGDYSTYSKLEAIELHQKLNIHPEWHFNDYVFGNFDWTIEPTESLKDLYVMRARQIRDRYDYLVLWYSSGSDSQCILNTFIDNDIKLDEIASFWALEGDKTYYSHLNQEIYECAIPHALKLTDKSKHIKHRIVDISSLMTDAFGQNDVKFDFMYYCSSMFSPNNVARSFFRERIDDYKNIIDSGKKLCFIYGADKPRVFLENGKYCLRFLDLVDTCVSNRTKVLNRPGEYDELFYWSADLPQLVSKQAHTVKNYLKSDHLDLNDFELDAKNKSFGSVELNGRRYYLTDRGLHKLIYGFHTHTVKPSNFAYSARDKWFWSNPQHIEPARGFINGIDKLQTVLPKYWYCDESDFYKGIKGCISPPYWLEK